MQITTSPSRGMLTIHVNPEQARELMEALPDGSKKFRLGAALSLLQSQMDPLAETTIRCPGSGAVGETNGALLICATCGRVIGTWPPHTLPEHEAPVFDDGREMVL